MNAAGGDTTARRAPRLPARSAGEPSTGSALCAVPWITACSTSSDTVTAPATAQKFRGPAPRCERGRRGAEALVHDRRGVQRPACEQPQPRQHEQAARRQRPSDRRRGREQEPRGDAATTGQQCWRSSAAAPRRDRRRRAARRSRRTPRKDRQHDADGDLAAQVMPDADTSAPAPNAAAGTVPRPVSPDARRRPRAEGRPARASPSVLTRGASLQPLRPTTRTSGWVRARPRRRPVAALGGAAPAVELSARMAA